MNGEFTHGFVVNRNEDFQERYFGWPSVVCLESGRILVGASGPRKYHADGLGKTSLFISHRLASTRFCDRILFLSDGRIAEEGTHDELIARGGDYAKLFEIQSCWYREDYKGGETA